MKYGRAFGAGVIGGVVMSLIMAMARAMGFMGLQASREMMLGMRLGGPPNLTTWALGFSTHLMAGGIFGMPMGPYSNTRRSMIIGWSGR